MFKRLPGSYKRNKHIKNLSNLKLKKNEKIFHAGTKIKDKKKFSNGGRVLNFTALGNNFLKIRKKILKQIKNLNWRHGFFRKDIGWKIIRK